MQKSKLIYKKDDAIVIPLRIVREDALGKILYT